MSAPQKLNQLIINRAKKQIHQLKFTSHSERLYEKQNCVASHVTETAAAKKDQSYLTEFIRYADRENCSLQ